MRSRRLPFLLLTLVVLLPLIGLGWLGWKLGQEQEYAWQRELDQLLQQDLWNIRDQAQLPLQVIAKQVDSALRQAGGDRQRQIQALRGLAFTEQLLLIGPAGERVYPAMTGDHTADQAAFLERTRGLWQDGLLLHAGDGPEEGAVPDVDGSGWMSWHWQQGMELLYWQRGSNGEVAAITVDTIGLLADIIAAMPDADEGRQTGWQLTDGADRVLYQWGGYVPDSRQRPRLQQALAPPLDSWQLALFFNDQPLRGSGSNLRMLQLVTGLGSLALVLLGLGIWLYRELRRAAREAAERVNFVSQVSHELRTPLTNIRMYAELLEDSVADDPPAQRKLAVIVSESRRLGRLIGNVLAFARQQKNTLQLHPQPASLDALLRETVAHFRPGLEARGIAVTLTTGVSTPVPMDADAVTAIIGNLLSNAEKYAPGKPLHITTLEQGGKALLRVRDHGPGIPRRYRKRIFEAFFRVSDRVTEGVSGTGIGLSIARELARLHGGELALRSRAAGEDAGTEFELVLPLQESGK